MGHRSPWNVCRGCVMPVALALLAGTAHAKPWAKWAPDPLASDSSYAALAARPADSLGTPEYAWVQVQRDWRAQRTGEWEGGLRGIASSGQEHVPRPADSRFAKLASQPYASLDESEAAWLIVENAAQRAARSGGNGSAVVGGVVVGAVVGGLVAVWAIGYAIRHMTFFP